MTMTPPLPGEWESLTDDQLTEALLAKGADPKHAATLVHRRFSGEADVAAIDEVLQ